MGTVARVAGERDIDALVALRRAWIEENAGGPIADDAFDSAFRSWWSSERSSRTFFVVEIDGSAVGMCNVSAYARMPTPGADARRWGYLGNMFVRPEHRDGGAGSVLLGAVVEWSRAQGLTHLTLNPSTRAVPFYERNGFARSGYLRLELST